MKEHDPGLTIPASPRGGGNHMLSTASRPRAVQLNGGLSIETNLLRSLKNARDDIAGHRSGVGAQNSRKEPGTDHRTSGGASLCSACRNWETRSRSLAVICLHPWSWTFARSATSDTMVRRYADWP